jgi:hypothetical protein
MPGSKEEHLSDDALLPELEPLNVALAAKERPKLGDLDAGFAYAAGKCFITQEELGELFGVSQPAVSKRLAKPDVHDAWKAGKAAAKMSVRRAQLRNAVVSGNVAAQIWLGKNELGQRDSPKEIDIKSDVQVRYVAEWSGDMPDQLPAGAQELELIEGEAVEEEDDE